MKAGVTRDEDNFASDAFASVLLVVSRPDVDHVGVDRTRTRVMKDSVLHLERGAVDDDRERRGSEHERRKGKWLEARRQAGCLESIEHVLSRTLSARRPSDLRADIRELV